MVHQAFDRFPVRAAVVRAEEDARRAAEPEPAVLAFAARLDVPGLLEREPALLGQAELLGARPALAAVSRSVHGRAVDEAVRGRVEAAVAAADRVDVDSGEVVGLAFVIELEFLNGRERLEGYDVFSLIKY
mgnify:CR=1 FL=1